MKKIAYILFIMSLVLFLQSKEIKINPKAKLFNTISSDLQTTKLQFNLDKYQMEEITQNGITYTKISYPLEGELYQVGKPDLPVFTRFVAISNHGKAHIKIEAKEFIVKNNILVYPRQSDEANSNEFIIDNEFYSKNIEFPARITKLYEPKILRDYRVVPVSFMPFQYNPKTKTLKIYTKISVTISVSNEKGINEKNITHKKSRAFEPFYKDIVVNYENIKNRDEFQDPSLLIIYFDNSNLLQYVNILAEWKRQKGFLVNLASTTDTGSNVNAIHSYIQNAYDTWENPPEYVMLIGDANQSDTYYIPTATVDGGAGDQEYTLLEGNDILADVIIGRLSVDTQTKMQTVLQKILSYEKNPYLQDTDWYKKAVLVGDPSQSGPSTISTNKYIKQVIQSAYPENEFLEQYSGNFVNFMETNLNEGALYFNYRGYIGMSGFGNSNIEQLNNGFMLPYVVDITCATGNFDSGSDESRSETFFFAGTPTNPKGGIAAIGTATSSTHTCFNNIVSASIFHSIFYEGIETAGGALTNAKYHLYLNYPQNPANHTTQFSYWNNLMGDPSLELWTEEPKSFDISYPNIVNLGTNNVLIHCSDDFGFSVQQARVTILSDDNQIFETGLTDENGDIVLSIAGAQVGTLKLTVTKRNYAPSLNEITVVSNYLNMAISGYSIDDSQGNNDMQINPGEDIGLTLTVMNNGSGSISNLSASIISHSDNINVTESNVDFNGTVNPGQTIDSSNQFHFQVNPDALDNEKISLQIEVSSNSFNITDILEIDLYAPLLIFDTIHLPGNPNMILDPGETSNLSIALKNNGSYDLSNVTATLSTETSYIQLDDDTGFYPSLPAGQSITNVNDFFVIEASVELVPGMIIPMELNLNTEDGFHQELMFNLYIGEQTVTDPLGPDSYGYFMYDDQDLSYSSCPSYNWIELNPDLGGDGEILNLQDSNDDDSAIMVIDLPINFKFYGNSYTSLTVCSDGWVSPGTHEQESFMNWRLPGPLAPMPLIAPFWDDLKMLSDSKVLYKYFPDNGIFIVEWSNLKNDYDDSYEETFEVILYDTNVSPTSTGDSNIIFQYKTINNVDQGEYGSYHVHHGQYATVGIQNDTGTIGLEYTFNNTYPTPAKPLQNEMAIAITGKPISYEQAHLTYASYSIIDNNNNNNQIDFGENIQLYIQLNNMGHQMAENVSAVLTTSDQYITMQNSSSAYPNIDELSSAENLQPFTFSVSPNIPNNHSILFNLVITSSTDTWNYTIPLIAYSPQIEYASFNIANDTNANGILNPGEMADLIVKLHNVGGAPLKNITATLTSNDEHLIINDDNFEWPVIYGNREFYVIFKISALADTPEQYVIPIDINLSSQSGFSYDLSCNVYMGLMVEDFETGDFSLFPWQFSSNPWQVIQGNAAVGNYSARSSDIDDNQTSEISISTQVSESSSISFYYKVSSEANWDYLRFFIDDNVLEQWSGDIEWTQFTADVSPGNHVFSWKYMKDGSVSHGEDCAWIDYIQFPGANGGTMPNPKLYFSDEEFHYVVSPDTVLTDTLYITNVGSGLVSYTASAENLQENILTLNNLEGSVYTGHINTVSFVLNTYNIPYGEYEANIIISDDREITTIPITISVEEVSEQNDIITPANNLFSSYPNPFRLSKASKNSGATIKFAIKNETPVKLEIYNLKGQKVKTIINEILKPGLYSPVWNGTNNTGKKVASGIYLYRLRTKDYQKVKKMVVLK